MIQRCHRRWQRHQIRGPELSKRLVQHPDGRDFRVVPLRHAPQCPYTAVLRAAGAPRPLRRRDKATLDFVWGGWGAVERMRLLVTERIFGINRHQVEGSRRRALSRQIGAGSRPYRPSRSGLRADKSILDKGELDVPAQLDTDIRQYEEGKAEEAELPF